MLNIITNKDVAKDDHGIAAEMEEKSKGESVGVQRQRSSRRVIEWMICRCHPRCFKDMPRISETLAGGKLSKD